MPPPNPPYLPYQKYIFVSTHDNQNDGCHVNGQAFFDPVDPENKDSGWHNVVHEYVPLNLDLGWMFNPCHGSLFRLFDIAFSFESRIERAKNRVSKNLDKWIENKKQELKNSQRVQKAVISFES